MGRVLRVLSVVVALALFGFLAYQGNLHRWLEQAVALGGDYKTFLWLLLFPWVVTVITFARQVIGLKTFGIYIPSVLAVALFAIGLRFGLLFLVVAFAVGTAIRYLLSGWRILDLPRRALVMIGVALTIIFILLWSLKKGYFLAQLAPVAVFPVLIIIVASERFITSQLRLPFWKAVSYSLQTLIAVIGAVFLIRWSVVQNFTWQYPEIVVLLMLANFALGRYTGLRLTEFWRFRKLIFE
ncbi:hypothetical protein J7L13_02835 [bacterium]|nr:hypothetical protein [bacterium]